MKQFVLKNYSNIGENMKKEEIKKASCFAFDVYEQWKGCDSLVTELKNIIKVMLPADEENARKTNLLGNIKSFLLLDSKNKKE